MADNLMLISVEGKYLVARSPVSNIELARAPVKGEGTDDHIAAGLLLIHDAFESLNAEGYPRANSPMGIKTLLIDGELL